MKRLLLIPALLGTMAMANEYKYEITPLVGYNIAEGNLGIDGDKYPVGGIAFQFNYKESSISPEFSFFTTKNADFSSNGTTNLLLGMFNVVYDYKNETFLKPFVKIGIGLDNYTTEKHGNDFGPLIDIGGGFKIDLTKEIALKAEAIYYAKYNSDHAGRFDSNLMTVVGISYAFGEVKETRVIQEEKKNIVKEKIIEVKEPVARVQDLDDDHDGVVNSLDKCPNTPTVVKVVDANGCIKDRDLKINFKFDSYSVDKKSRENIKLFAKFLLETPIYEVTIIGHTDGVGTKKYNKKLSAKRAEVVRRLLIEDGIDKDLIKTKAMGESQPIATNKTYPGRAKNRRIEAHLERIK